MTSYVSVAWPQKGGKVHRIDGDTRIPTVRGFAAGEGKVAAACGRRVQIATSAFGDEPRFRVRSIAHGEFMRDVDACEGCKAVVRAGR